MSAKLPPDPPLPPEPDHSDALRLGWALGLSTGFATGVVAACSLPAPVPVVVIVLLGLVVIGTACCLAIKGGDDALGRFLFTGVIGFAVGGAPWLLPWIFVHWIVKWG